MTDDSNVGRGDGGFSRRGFLTASAAGLAGASLSACSDGTEQDATGGSPGHSAIAAPRRSGG